MIFGNLDSTCRVVEDCPFVEDCKNDEKADYYLCPMKFLSFDQLLSEPVACYECDSLNEFESTIDKKLTIQDHKDLNLCWMEHLNSHLGSFECKNVTGAESRQI